MNNELFDALKQRYPTIHHGPFANCPQCKGTGDIEHTIEGKRACICLFVSHEHLPLVFAITHEVCMTLSEEFNRRAAMWREDQES